MPVINVELDIVDAQEVASSLRTMVRKIDYILETNPPGKPGDASRLDIRAKQLTIVAHSIETALHQRALNNVEK